MAVEPFFSHYICTWTGGFFYWMISGFKGKYSEQLTEEKEKRNGWTGYFLLGILFVIIILIAIASSWK